ncbi:MAG: hypothetical protein K6A30_04530 [Lachnospiraceae bacterium]|nr:hypothetical protein [Lachnospiraceae bacterium]
MMKMNFTNDQIAFEYALYMIASSYFAKTKCISKLTEKKMLLQYKEQKLERQYQMEDICIGFMEDFSKKTPSQLFHRQMEVKLNRWSGGLTEIIFYDNRYIVAFQGLYAGKKSKIRCNVWVKTLNEKLNAS